MIALTRRLIFFDLETTGPNPEQDRIVSLAFREYKPYDPSQPSTANPRAYSHLINPGVPIPKGATEVHGITDADVVGKPSFSEMAPHLLRGFHDCDYGGFNIRYYDLPLLAAEFARAGHQWSYAEANIVDVMRLWNVLETRKLSNAVQKFLGRDHEEAHDAQGDVDAVVQVFEAMLTQFRGKIPPTVAEIHQLLFPRDPNAIDPDGKLVWRGSDAVINFGKHKGQPLAIVPRTYLDWIVNKAEGMPDAFRGLCRDALAGKFPEKKEGA